MKKPKILGSLMLTLVLSVALVLAGCSPGNTSKLRVVTSTSLIAQIAERVGGEQVEVANIIPPAQCPGHFDIKPGDTQKLADADLFLLHGWQGEKFSQDLIASANNPDLNVVRLDIEGNWMTPSVQKEATDEIMRALCQVDVQNSTIYQQRAEDYKDVISAKETELRAKLDQANLPAVNVLCAEMQTGFVVWTGLNVIATYGRPDSLTPQVVRELVDIGREANVTLIIDNLQSGQDAGKAIAEELGCQRIILSNFPGGFSDTETWEKAIEKNIELILEAVAKQD